MKVTDILNEDQLDELSWGGVAKGIGAGVRGTAKAAGATVGGVVGAGRAFKQGYDAGNRVVGGPKNGNPFTPQGVQGQPAQQQRPIRRGAAPASQPAPQQQQAPASGDPVATISALLPKLNPKQLSALKLAIDQYTQRSAPRSRAPRPAAAPTAAPAPVAATP